MARLSSFHLAPEAWPVDGRAFLRGSEVNHMCRVLRHKSGDTVRLFDGQGRWGLFEIVSIDRKVAELCLLQEHEDNAPRGLLTLALGWNKSSRRDWILEKSVELGADEIVFWQTIRSQGKVPAQPKDTWNDRLIQAAKQCGASRLPRLQTRSSAEELIHFSADYEQKILLWEAGERIPLLSPTMLSKGKTIAIVGPEGGLDAHEATQFQDAGFIPVTLGASILRWETAALHCLSLAFYASQS